MRNFSLDSKVTLEHFKDARFPFPASRVSHVSSFRSLTWDFYDPSKSRQLSVSRSKLRIEWAVYLKPSTGESESHERAFLTRPLIEELRVFAFFYYKAPGHFGLSKRTIKPNTLVALIRSLVSLFSRIDDIRESYHADLVTAKFISGRYARLQSISEVTLIDLKEALAESEQRDGSRLKVGLQLLCHPLLVGRFKQSLQWTHEEAAGLDYRYSETRSDYKRVMPDELFRTLSNTATDDVRKFLSFLGRTGEDGSPRQHINPTFHGIDGQAYFSLYVQMRDKDRVASHRLGKKTSNSRKERVRLVEMGIAPVMFFSYLLRVRNAALSLVGLYTGGRWSDYSGFKHGCIKLRHGYPVIEGTLVKNQPENAAEGEDFWPAIPILRDAVAVLEQLTDITHNPFLFSASDTVPIGGAEQPISLVGFTTAINDYLAQIDEGEVWSGWRINPHQLRHTLARQLANADVGTVFISYQLKHLYTALASLPPDVTLGYGNLSQQRMDRAMARADANLDAARALFDPDAPVAGGGAEEFKARRKTYFEGKAAAGWSTEETIKNLAAAGMPFVSVGPGYCGGIKEETMKDGRKIPPPCIGDLQCNPGDCGQSIITTIHKRHWERIREKNIELSSNPDLAYAKPNFEKAILTSERVLSDLGGT